MARYLRPSVVVLAPLALGVLSVGCAVPFLARDSTWPAAAVAEAGGTAAEPDVLHWVADALPATTTMLANGVIWVGCNVLTVEGADLTSYDSGDGSSFGVAFGNGEDVKRFLEVAYEETDGHLVRSATATQGDATHRRFYVGARYYLLPSAGRAVRAVPLVMAGVAWHTLDNYGSGGTADTDVEHATGLGVYVGTGLELYISGQLAICFDLRASYWNWEGVPEDTGAQGTVGSALTLAFHF